MAVIYLRHERHGTKVALSPEEAAYDRKSGWKEFDPTAPFQTDAETAAENVMVKRRGRPPKQET